MCHTTLASLNCTVLAIVEQLRAVAPINATGISIQKGLKHDLRLFIEEQSSKAQSDFRSNDRKHSPQFLLELYARRQLARAIQEVYYNYETENHKVLAHKLQECYQSSILLSEAPSLEFNSLNNFIGTLLGTAATLGEQLVAVTGKLFTRNAVLAIITEMIAEGSLRYQDIINSSSFDNAQNALSLQSQTLMHVFKDDLSRVCYIPDYASRINITQELVANSSSSAINPLHFTATGVGYENGYFGLNGRDVLAKVLNDTYKIMTRQ